MRGETLKIAFKKFSIPYSKQAILYTVNCFLFNLNSGWDWLHCVQGS